MFRLFNYNKVCEIEKVENGWIVRLRYPKIPSLPSTEAQKQQLKIMSRIIALLSRISAQEQAKGIDEELEPWKEEKSEEEFEEMMREIDRIIEATFDKVKIVKEKEEREKYDETYVFINLDDALNFVRSFFAE
jgi:Zn-dependent M32 family carboxypeptidase